MTPKTMRENGERFIAKMEHSLKEQGEQMYNDRSTGTAKAQWAMDNKLFIDGMKTMLEYLASK